MAVDKEELIKLQEEDSTLQKLKEAKKNRNKKGIQDFLRKNVKFLVPDTSAKG